jgi:hypothetical protein
MTVAENKQPSPEAMDLLADTLLASPDAVPHGLELARQYGRRDIALSGSPTLRQRQRLQQIDRALSLRPASAPARSR